MKYLLILLSVVLLTGCENKQCPSSKLEKDMTIEQVLHICGLPSTVVVDIDKGDKREFYRYQHGMDEDYVSFRNGVVYESSIN